MEALRVFKKSLCTLTMLFGGLMGCSKEIDINNMQENPNEKSLESFRGNDNNEPTNQGNIKTEYNFIKIKKCRLPCCCCLFLLVIIGVGLGVFLLPCFGVYGSPETPVLEWTYNKCYPNVTNTEINTARMLQGTNIFYNENFEYISKI